MKTNVLATVVVTVMVCSVVSAGIAPHADATETPTHDAAPDGDFGEDVSAFMQRGVATTNASVDAGMWREAFESADNHTRKRALVDRRTAVLGARLDRLEARIERFTSTSTNGSMPPALRRVRLVADRNALRTSVAEAKTTVASAGVNDTRLDGLDRRLANLTVGDADRRNRSATNGMSDEPTETTAGDRRSPGITYGGP